MEGIKARTNVSVHPVKVLKSGIKTLTADFWKFLSVYLIFNLPFSIASLFLFNLAVGKPQEAKNWGLIAVVWAAGILISSWGAISLLILAAKKESQAIQAIRKASRHYLPYIFTGMLYFLLLWAIALTGIFLSLLFAAIFYYTNYALGVIIGLVVSLPFIFGLVYFFIRLSLGAVACVLEGIGPVAALKRSHSLIKDHVTAVTGAFSLIVIIALVLFLVLVLAPNLVVSNIIINASKNITHAMAIVNVTAWATNFIVNMIAMCLFACVFVNLYNAIKGENN